MNEAVNNMLPYERELFFALNGSDSTYWDNLMWTVTGRWIWVPVVLMLLYALFYKKSFKQSLLVLLTIVIVITLCDQVASSIFKPLFHRFRPTHHPDFEQWVDMVNGYRSGLYGFISSHAANSFGLATFLALLFRNKWFTAVILFWALLNSYSRIYLGVHFVSDIVVGALVGSLIAYGAYIGYCYLRKMVFPNSHSVLYTARDAQRFAIGLFGYLVLIAVACPWLAELKH